MVGEVEEGDRRRDTDRLPVAGLRLVRTDRDGSAEARREPDEERRRDDGIGLERRADVERDGEKILRDPEDCLPIERRGLNDRDGARGTERDALLLDEGLRIRADDDRPTLLDFPADRRLGARPRRPCADATESHARTVKRAHTATSPARICFRLFIALALS